jgi:hypothetical protein
MRARILPEKNGIVGTLRIEARTLWKVKDDVKGSRPRRP